MSLTLTISLIEATLILPGCTTLILLVPILLFGKEENFTGLIDLVQNIAYIFEDTTDPLGMNPVTREVPEDMKALTKEYRDKLVEAVSDFDDVIAEQYVAVKDGHDQIRDLRDAHHNA